MSRQFSVEWNDMGRKPETPPNPAYPEGIDVDATKGQRPACFVPIPYPTGHENIGYWLITCRVCRAKGIVTAASRPDDPRSLMMPCKRRGTVQ